MPTLGQQGLDILSRYGLVSSGTAIPNTSRLGYLRNLLKGEMNRQFTNPYEKEWRAAADKSISAQTRQALDFLRQQTALSGFRGMVDPNAVSNVLEKATIARQEVERGIQATSLDLLKSQMAYRENAIARLLGLEQFATQFEAQVGLDLLGKGIQVSEGAANRAVQLQIAEMQRRAQESAAIGQIFGGLFGAAGTIGLYQWLKQ